MPSLPILPITSQADPATLLRHFHHAQSQWAAHLSDPQTTDLGTAFINSQMPTVHDANQIFDFASDASLISLENYFSAHNARCLRCSINPSSIDAPRESEFLTAGFARRSTNIFHLPRPQTPPGSQSNLRIIPARAGFEKTREFFSEIFHADPQHVEAAMLHLDDPHYDSLIAISDGKAIAHVGVLAIGNIGLIEQWSVLESSRRRGIGRAMLSRAIEIAARSIFEHLLLEVAPHNLAATALVEQFGFRKTGEYLRYERTK